MKKFILVLVLSCLSMGIKADQFTLEQAKQIGEEITSILANVGISNQTIILINVEIKDLISSILAYKTDSSIDAEYLADHFSLILEDYQIENVDIRSVIEKHKNIQRPSHNIGQQDDQKHPAEPANNNITQEYKYSEDEDLEFALALSLSDQKPSASTTEENPKQINEKEKSPTCVFCQDDEYTKEDSSFKLTANCKHTLGHNSCISNWYRRELEGKNTYEVDMQLGIYTLHCSGRINFSCPLCKKNIDPIDRKYMEDLAKDRSSNS